MGEKELLERGLLLRRTNPSPFLVKTYMLVDDPASDAVVSWNEGGTAFVVWQPAEFARDLLPTLFKHCNFSSFVRQLNTYGFRKVTTSRWEFCNDMFQRGKQELLCQIRRRKAWSNRQQPPAVAVPAPSVQTNSDAPQTRDEDQRSSSTFFSSEFNVLVDENKKLKKENGVLMSELVTMKKKCRDLLQLVAICANEMEMENDDSGDDDNKNRPMLFGVRLELQEERKRKRKRSTQVYATARRLLSQSCK